MTDKQIRDRIVGALSVSMMPMEMEAECVAFLDRCLNAPKWIPVTERFPEEGDRCLCNVKSFAFPGSFYQAILRYSKDGFQDGCVYEEGVTHWMPLPEPPKEEANGNS